MMMIISHGASFLVDTLVTTTSKSYAGLFQLNYLSLMVFSKHLLQYLLNSYKRYNELLTQALDTGFEISTLDSAGMATSARTSCVQRRIATSLISLMLMRCDTRING